MQETNNTLRADSKLCKRQIIHKLSTEISFDAANKIVPDSFFNFTAMLLCDKTLELQDSGRVMVDQPTTETALIISQQLLQHISGVPTPLSP